MNLTIDVTNGLAIDDQIVWQLEFAIASGTLRRGELLPSVRGLSKPLAINPNTVARVLAENPQVHGLELPYTKPRPVRTPASARQNDPPPSLGSAFELSNMFKAADIDIFEG